MSCICQQPHKETDKNHSFLALETDKVWSGLRTFFVALHITSSFLSFLLDKGEMGTFCALCSLHSTSHQARGTPTAKYNCKTQSQRQASPDRFCVHKSGKAHGAVFTVHDET